MSLSATVGSTLKTWNTYNTGKSILNNTIEILYGDDVTLPAWRSKRKVNTMSDSTEQLDEFDRQSPKEAKRTKRNGGKGTVVTLGIACVLIVFIAGAALVVGNGESPESESDPSECAEVVGKTVTLRGPELAIADETDDPISWLSDSLVPEHECASSKVRVSA